MSLEEVEKRIQLLEDLEAIKKLKVRYARVCDDGFDPEEMVKLFTENAVWEAKPLGRYEGREGIRKFAEEASKQFVFSVHYFVGPYIEIDGNKARGRWYTWCPATMAGGKGVWASAVEDDKYEKVNGEWLISELKVTVWFNTPYEEGWHKTRFLD